MFGFSNIFNPRTAGGGGGGGGGVLPSFDKLCSGVLPTFKIFSKADENFCLTARNGAAVLAFADFTDEHQHWYKDKRFGIYLKDEEGKPAFSLINKATGLAVQHFGGPYHPVKLVPFVLDSLDKTLMWTMSNNDGFGFIRTLNDISLTMAAFPENHDVTIKLSDSCNEDTHHWKILPWINDVVTVGGQGMRLYCKANEGFSVAVRNGNVCLAPTDPNDLHQHWVEDMRYRDVISDEDGYPAFALINRATGDAMKKSEAKEGPVELAQYDPHYLDKSVLWSKSSDITHDFHYIRMIDNIYLNLEMCDTDHHYKYLGKEEDCTEVMLSQWRRDDSQYWRMVPWCKSPWIHKRLLIAAAFFLIFDIFYFIKFYVACYYKKGSSEKVYTRRRVRKPAAE